MNKFTKAFIFAAINRAVRTMAQVALSMLTVGMTFNEVDWLAVLSIAGVAGIFSLLTSVVTNLPETPTDGEIIVSTDGEEELYSFHSSDLKNIGDAKQIVLSVSKVDVTPKDIPQ